MGEFFKFFRKFLIKAGSQHNGGAAPLFLLLGLEFERFFSALGMKADLFIPKLRIAIHISDDMDLEFYKATCRPYRPFFVRRTETKEFTLEKIQNCIIDAMNFQQKMYNKRMEARKHE